MEGLFGLLLLGGGCLVLLRARRGASPRPTATDIDPHGAPELASDLAPDLAPDGGQPRGVRPAPGAYAALALATSGYRPLTDHITELALLTCDADGRIRDEYVTCVTPHGADRSAYAGAPTFAQILPEVLDRMAGRVLVVHLPGYTAEFLAAEMLRAGVLPPVIEAVSTMHLAQGRVGAPNPRLGTLAAAAGVRTIDVSTTLGQARAVAALAAALAPLPARCAPLAFDSWQHPFVVGRARPVPPPVTGEPARQRWVAELLAGIPMTAAEAHDARVTAFLSDLENVLGQRGVAPAHVRAIIGRFVAAGFRTEAIRGLMARLVEGLREAAFTYPELRPEDVGTLRALAVAVGLPSYFDDQIPTPTPLQPVAGSGTFSRPVRRQPAPPPRPRVPRCGSCLAIGHYSSACPAPHARTGTTTLG